MQDPGQLSAPGVPDSPARGSATLSAVSHLSAERAILLRQGPPLPLFQTVHSGRPGPRLMFSSVSKAKSSARHAGGSANARERTQAVGEPGPPLHVGSAGNQETGWGLKSGVESAVLVSVLCERLQAGRLEDSGQDKIKKAESEEGWKRRAGGRPISGPKMPALSRKTFTSRV